MVRRFVGSTLVFFALMLVLSGVAMAAPNASVTFFPLHQSGSRPYTIVTGPDGNLWFTESGAPPGQPSAAAIGRITPDG
jgi:streptogramin lyase